MQSLKVNKSKTWVRKHKYLGSVKTFVAYPDGAGGLV